MKRVAGKLSTMFNVYYGRPAKKKKKYATNAEFANYLFKTDIDSLMQNVEQMLLRTRTLITEKIEDFAV